MSLTDDWSDAALHALVALCRRHGWNPEHPLGVMFHESGARAGAHNPNGHASGLVQMMPATLVGLGWRAGHEAFRELTVDGQLPYVEKYFAQYETQGLDSVARFYLATFLPALLFKPGSHDMGFVLCGLEATLHPDMTHDEIVTAAQTGSIRGPLEWAYKANSVFDRAARGYIILQDLEDAAGRASNGSRAIELMGRLRGLMFAQAETLPPVFLDEAPTDIPITQHIEGVLDAAEEQRREEELDELEDPKKIGP